MATSRSHTYGCRLEWRSGPAEAGGSMEDYSREHTVAASGGKAPLKLSAAPEFRGDPALMNPEELFVAALSSCQMLTYLALAARAGVRVVSYMDDAAGTLAPGRHPATGRSVMRIERVLLRPRIEVASGSDTAKAKDLVEKAHETCFIANSVGCEVAAEPEVRVV